MKIAALRAISLAALIVTALSSLLFFTLHANAAPIKGSAVASPQQGGESMRFVGTFTNTQVNVSGDMTINITINADDTIVGAVEFSQFSSGATNCGGGDFSGTKEDETIELSFTSDNSDPACGFNDGVAFTIEAALLNNTIIRGNYTTDTGQQGIVELRRLFNAGVYIPLVTRQENK